jgi:hypothetical protein
MKLIKQLSSILAIAVLVACGGTGMRATSRDASQGGGGVLSSGAGGLAGTGGIGIILGGDPSQGGAPSGGGGSGSDLNAVVLDGGVTICSCGFSSNPACDQSTLWNVVSQSAVSTLGDYICEASLGPITDGGTANGGYIVLDSEGRVIDNSVFAADEFAKQAWLDSLAYYRWPCLAGESIPFTCVWGTF